LAPPTSTPSFLRAVVSSGHDRADGERRIDLRFPGVLDRSQQIVQSDGRNAVRLNRNKYLIRRSQSIDREQSEVGQAVNQDYVPALAELGERALDSGLDTDAAAQIVDRGKLAAARDDLDACDRRLAHVGLEISLLGDGAIETGLSTAPQPQTGRCLRIKSTTRQRKPRSARTAARLIVVVVLPLPPFSFITAMVRIVASPYSWKSTRVQ
jgi:hypothetical protein